MKDNKFFEKQTISSRVKAGIISEYFPSYCKIIIRKYRPKAVRYIDLFSGPGMYEDGNPSTPILIGRHCRSDDELRIIVKLIFNDYIFSAALKENFEKEFPVGTFPNKPHYGASTVGKSKEITDFLIADTHTGERNDYPSLLFIDPFGYKGIETKVLAEFLKYWGNEIFLFVNTTRIHPALVNDKFEGLMMDLFPTTFQQIKEDRRYKSTVAARLSLIIDSLGSEYRSIIRGKVYYTAFKFQEEDADATSHYILHLTKGDRGYDLIKTIYNDFANVGTIFDGVNTYTFDAKQFEKPVNELFDLKSLNIDKLKDEIYLKFKGQKVTAYDLYETHHITGLYSHAHYTEALRRLVSEGKLTSYYTDNKLHRKSVIISKDCKLKFK